MHIQGVDSKSSTLWNTCRGSILYSNNRKGFVKQWGSNSVTTLGGELEGDKLRISIQMWMSGHARGITFTLQGQSCWPYFLHSIMCWLGWHSSPWGLVPWMWSPCCWQPTRQCGMPHVQPYRFWWVLHPVCLVTAFPFPGVSGLLCSSSPTTSHISSIMATDLTAAMGARRWVMADACFMGC